MPYQSDKRLSEILPSLDPSLDADLKAEAQVYVCSDCKTADSDPFVGLLDRGFVFYCLRCRLEDREEYMNQRLKDAHVVVGEKLVE